MPRRTQLPAAPGPGQATLRFTLSIGHTNVVVQHNTGTVNVGGGWTVATGCGRGAAARAHAQEVRADPARGAL